MNTTIGEAQVQGILSQDPIDRSALPSEVEVAIIGGGIVGVSTAYFLSKHGIKTALFEKGCLACEQSGRNWGWVRQQGRAAQELPVMIRSNQIWQEWQTELDTGFEIGGCLYLARDERELAEHEAWLDVARQHELNTTIIQGAALEQLLPGHGDKWAGGLYTPNDGRAEPNRATRAIANAAVEQGAAIYEGCAVRGIEQSAGQISSLSNRTWTCADIHGCLCGWCLDFNICPITKHHHPAIENQRYCGQNRTDPRSNCRYRMDAGGGDSSKTRWWIHRGSWQRVRAFHRPGELSIWTSFRACI